MSDERWKRVATHVGEEFRRAKERPGWDPVFTANYRWEHTLRATYYGELIAVAEGVDVSLARAACLLHDIAYFSLDGEQNWDDHGRIGARLARPVLAAAGYVPEEVTAIAHAIATHVDGRADDDAPTTPLDDVVSDADNVDRFSAYRVIAWCMAEREDFHRMAEMARGRLARLHKYRALSPLATKAGKHLFAAQVELQIGLFEGLVRDAEITRLPSDGAT